MNQPLTGSEVTSAVGFFLTLTGLLTTFFYVQLSNWFREILELRSKYEENSVGEDDRRRVARIECRFQLKRLFNHVPAMTSAVVTTFIVVITCLSFSMIGQIAPHPALFDYYSTALWIFLVAYLLLTLYFLLHGYGIAFWIHRNMKAKG